MISIFYNEISYSQKNILILFLLFILNKISYEEIITYSFPYHKYPKSFTLLNGYKLLITGLCINSFDTNFYPTDNSYMYKQNELPVDSIEETKFYVEKSDISQFSGEDINEKQYVLLLLNKFIFVISEVGKVLFSIDISEKIDNSDFPMSLVAYKYDNGFYYFTVGYNNILTYDIYFYYFRLSINNDIEGEITLVANKFDRLRAINGNDFWFKSENLPCQRMKNNQYNILLTCYYGISEIYNSLVAISYDPESDFSVLFNSNIYIDEADNKEIKYVYSSVNSDRTKALVCYTIEDSKGKCVSYDINENLISNLNLESQYCYNSLFGLKSYFFEETKEFVFSCIDGNNHFFMKRLDENFNIVNDEDMYKEKQFTHCDNYSEFSLVFANKTYFLMLDTYYNQEKEYILTFELNTTNLPSFLEETPETTFPNIISTPIEETPETTIPNIISTPIEETSETTNLNMISTSIENPPEEIGTTLSKMDITSTMPLILVTTILKEKNSIEITDISTEKQCNDIGKKYSNGICICDIDNGYYSLKSKYSHNECYQLNEIPKNFYFNITSQSYESCYSTCGECEKEGNYLENNCIACKNNYVREPENKTSNCVEECKYLYYYNSLGEYSCTEDEQCPVDASLIIRDKNKCINKCFRDNKFIYQYNGECLSECPIGTKPNELNICKISDISECSISDFKLDLNKAINTDNILLVAKNYVNEFHYTINHISKFNSLNFTMILYRNSSCIDELKVNVTKIEYESCIQQLKIDNNIDEKTDLLIAVIDIINGNNPITSFGFFNPNTGEKLDASKSCSSKNVLMYENILNILNEPLLLDLIKDKKINIFDLNSEFYTDICYHFVSPNGKDCPLQDRIKTFYPNVTLCDNGCKNRGINITSMKTKCECTFHDLLNKDIFNKDIFMDNVLINEALKEVGEMLSNLNIEVLSCYKDVFNFYYFKRNIGGFIILVIIILENICIFLYFYKYKMIMIKTIYFLTENLILKERKEKKDNKSENFKLKDKNISKKYEIKISPPSKNSKNKYEKLSIAKKKKNSESKNKNFIINNLNNKNIATNTTKKSSIGNTLNSNKCLLLLNKQKNNIKKHSTILNNKETSRLLINNKLNIYENKKDKKEKLNKILIKPKKNYNVVTPTNINIDLENFLKENFENNDFDDVLDEDKRTYCQYFFEKLTKSIKIIDSFCILEITKPRPIKILIFLLTINLYFLINGLFYSDSYISQVFNSEEKEVVFTFIKRSASRFAYSTIVGQIIASIVELFTSDESIIKKKLLKKYRTTLILRFEISEIIKSIIIKINILLVLNYIISIFSWYYISCFNNVYPNLKNEWIITSIFIIILVQILAIFFSFLETLIRFLSIKCESEKLFKLSLLFP